MTNLYAFYMYICTAESFQTTHQLLLFPLLFEHLRYFIFNSDVIDTLISKSNLRYFYAFVCVYLPTVKKEIHCLIFGLLFLTTHILLNSYLHVLFYFQTLIIINLQKEF